MSRNDNIIQNIVGGWNKSDVRIANLSDSVNMYVETQGTGASTTSMLRSIYGSSVYSNVNDKPCRGLYECSRGIDGNPILFGVYGKCLYVFRDNVAELIYSNLTNDNNAVGICETGGEGSANPHLVIVDGANVVTVNTELSTAEMRNDIRTIALPYRVRQIDESNPTQRIQPTHCAYCYNYLIVNDAGTDAFYISYQFPFERLNEKTNKVDYDIFMVDPWKETEVGYKDYGFITYSDWMPDNITALVGNGTLLYTFGPKSSEIFTYTSDDTAPWKSPTNAANGIGIKAEHSIGCLGNYVFFLGASSIGENGIYRYESNQLSKISTPDIERAISKISNTSDAIGQCWMENGHLFYALSFINGDITFVYDCMENQWHRRASKDPNSNVQHYWRLMFAVLHDSKLMFGTSDGKLVYLDESRFVEYDNIPMIRIRRSGMMMNNFQSYIVDKIKLICNAGDFVHPNMVPKIMMRYNENGGPWSNQEISLMGNAGQYNFDVEWYNLGLHNIMCVEFSCSDDINFCILNGKISYGLLDV